MEEFVAHPAMQPPPPPQFHQEEEKLRCPRCDSFNTKFCYYNNYNLAQPRHYCKNCKRYWTKGGSLRNIPVGGSSRKSKNSKRSASPTSSAAASSKKVALSPAASSSSNSNSAHRSEPGAEPERRMTEMNAFSEQEGLILNMGSGEGGGAGGFGFSFSSLLGSDGRIRGDCPEAGGINGLGYPTDHPDSGQVLDPAMVVNGGNGSGNSGVENGSEQWSGGGNMWPDLAIYTPPYPTFE